MILLVMIALISGVAGSSRGRGTRAAGWFDDLIADKGDTRMRSLTLEGGIKAWATGGEEYQKYMVGLEKGIWEQ
jgi:arsenical-resistance protein 2